MALPVPLRPIPLWKEKWDKDALIARHDLNPRSFERGFRMRAYSDEDATFPSFEHCRQPVVLGEIARNDWPCVFGVDLSSKKRPGNCIFAGKVDPYSRRRYPLEVRFGAWKGSELLENIRDMDMTYHPTIIMVEDNGYQESLIDWCSDRKTDFPFWMKIEPTTTTGGRKNDPEKGLPALEVEFKHQAWVIPHLEYEGATREEKGPRGAWARWDYEFAFHPVASTSDGVMATYFFRQGIETHLNLDWVTGGSLGDINAR